jgi:hypothetical protein
MARIQLPAAINLAYWLYKVHPEIFSSLLNQSRAQTSTMGALGQDDGGDFLPGISLMPDVTSDVSDIGSFSASSDVGSFVPSDIGATISPDLWDFQPELSDVSFDSSSSLVTPISSGTTSAINTAAANIDSSTASSIGSVASLLTAGLGSLAAITTAVYKAGSPQATTIAAQAQRAAAGAPAAPLTYAYNSSGQLVPVLQTGAQSGVALTPQNLSSLVPSSWGQYVIPVGVGVLVAIAIYAGTRK